MIEWWVCTEDIRLFGLFSFFKNLAGPTNKIIKCLWQLISQTMCACNIAPRASYMWENVCTYIHTQLYSRTPFEKPSKIRCKYRKVVKFCFNVIGIQHVFELVSDSGLQHTACPEALITFVKSWDTTFQALSSISMMDVISLVYNFP